MIRSATFYGQPGLQFITDDSLVGVDILGVKREGICYTFQPVVAVMDETEWGYLSPFGTIIFANPFAGPTFGRPNRLLFERVWVLYKALI